MVERDGFVFCDLSQAEPNYGFDRRRRNGLRRGLSPGQMERPARKSR